MQRCLDLAIKGLGSVAPNPMVGCVIVHDGKIIGEGYHSKFGEAHAEVNAINSIPNHELLNESTLYVNLEPCSHFGKTPPCVDLILQKKISKVVVGSYDPNSLVAGQGIRKLKKEGVEVITEVLKRESDFANRRFFTFHTKQRPYIILKWAQSGDGFMGLNERKQFWFTNDESKKLTHKWRSEEQAILAGRNTVEVDNPELTVRLWKGNNPLRIIIDKELKLNTDKKIFNGKAQTLVFNQKESKTNGTARFQKIDFSAKVVEQILDELYKLNILSVIVEGGAETLSHFVRQNMWDEVRVFTTEHLLKQGKQPPHISGRLLEETLIEKDELKIFLNTTL